MGTLTPAYGRDYKSRKEVVVALNEGKDFFMNGFGGSGYCNVKDLPDGFINVRYKKLTQVAVITIKEGVAS